MYRKILVGYDGSEQAEDALAFGKQLADAAGAELVVAGVRPLAQMWSGVDPAIDEAEAEFSDRVGAAAKSVGAKGERVLSTSPARGLHDRAEQIEADLIVVGSCRHGRLGQTFVGSVGVALLHGSPCAVAIAPHGYRDQSDRDIETIVVGFDGSPESGLALMAASRLARGIGARVKLVAAAEPPPLPRGRGASGGWHALKKAIEDDVRDTLTQGCSAVPEGIDAEPILVSGEPAAALSETAKEPGTVLILGSRGYGPLRRVLLGSVSRALVRSAPSPVLIHPRGTHEPARQTRPAQAETAS
jgi:nucleotide-binding universal stress UspA family protein